MIDPIVFIGEPIQFGKICKIYPPKVKDVITNPRISQLFQLLTYSQGDIEDLFQSVDKKDAREQQKRIPTPLEFILINSYKSKEFESLVQEAFMVFIHEPITFLYETKMILIGEAKDILTETDLHAFRLLQEENFFDFQNLIRESFGKEKEDLPDPNESPIVAHVKAAARRRKRLAAKTKQKSGRGISLTTSLGAICCMGIGLTPLNIGEISYASIDVLTTLYQQKEKYQTDIDSLMAGADPKKVHPKYWIREENNNI